MTTTAYSDYSEKLVSDAKDFVNEIWDDLLEKIKEGISTSSFYWHDFIDSDTGRLHDFMDEDISAREALDILENCIEKETDNGMWMGIEDPIRVIESMGFWTYKGDLGRMAIEVAKERLEELLETETDKASSMADALEALESQLSDMQDREENTSPSAISDSKKKIEALEEEISDQEDYCTNIQIAIDAH